MPDVKQDIVLFQDTFHFISFKVAAFCFYFMVHFTFSVYSGKMTILIKKPAGVIWAVRVFPGNESDVLELYVFCLVGAEAWFRTGSGLPPLHSSSTEKSQVTGPQDNRVSHDCKYSFFPSYGRHGLLTGDHRYERTLSPRVWSQWIGKECYHKAFVVLQSLKVSKNSESKPVFYKTASSCFGMFYLQEQSASVQGERQSLRYFSSVALSDKCPLSRCWHAASYVL